jgi:type IV pilus assembly protein PilV
MKNQGGFTLIEVLIAMAILSFGLLSVAGMQSVAIHVNSSANKLTRATTLAQDKIEELLALPFTHVNLRDQNPDDCEMHNEANPPEGYTLSWCVQGLDTNGDGTVDTKDVDVTATWHQGGEGKPFTLSFVRTVFMP